MATCCSHCGTKLSDEAHFCFICAAPVATGLEEQELIFFAAITAGDVEEVKAFLIREPSLVNARDVNKWSRTPLHAAVLSGNEAIVKLLLEHGAEVDARDCKGFTPLHLSARQAGSEEIVKALLDYGADPNARSRESHMTPLLEAAWAGRAKVVESLCLHGANVDVMDDYDITPVKAASLGKRQRHLDAISVLHLYGAKE